MTINELITEIEKGKIGIPKGIQRGFVWKSNRVLKLLDSIYKNYPIGIIVLWKISESELSAEISTSIIKTDSSTIPEYLVVDGLQRLISFVLISKGSAKVIDIGGEYREKRINLYFNPEREEFSLRKYGDKWLKVPEILARPDELVDKISDKKLLRKVLRNFNELLSRSVPVYELKGDTSLDNIVEIFDRINSTGVKVTIAQLITAYIYVVDPELNRAILKYLQNLGERGWKLNITTLIKIFSYRITGSAFVNSLKEHIIENKGNIEKLCEKLEKEWKKTEKALTDALDLIKSELGISKSKYLPSETSLTSLAIALSYMDDYGILRTEDINRQLSLWFLLTSWFGRYTGATEAKIKDDMDSFRRVLEESRNVTKAAAALTENLRKVYGNIEITPDKFSKDNKYNRALLYFALRESDARDFFKGIKIEVLSIDNVHHIFPRSMLRKKKDYRDDIANITILAEETNRKIGNRKPECYLKEVSKEILEKHFIPLDEGLWNIENYRAFLEERRKMIIDFINERIRKFF